MTRLTAAPGPSPEKVATFKRDGFVVIEDLLDALIYEKLVRDSHAPEIGKKKLTVNDRIPRLAKRMEQALKGVDVRVILTGTVDHYLPWLAAHAFFDDIRAA